MDFKEKKVGFFYFAQYLNSKLKLIDHSPLLSYEIDQLFYQTKN
jgi:hypothetical protein